MLMIHNPSSGIVTLNVRALSGKAAPIDIETEVEVGAGDSIFVSLPMAKMQGSADWVVTVRASGEVAVEQLLTFATQNDLSFGSAVAVLGPG